MPKFPLESGGRLLYLGSSEENDKINTGLVVPLLNATTLNNKTRGTYELFNEFFFFHNEKKIVQIRTKPGAKVKLFVKDYVGKVLQELETGKHVLIYLSGNEHN